MKTKVSQFRKFYKIRYVFRLCVLLFTLIMYFNKPDSFAVLDGLNFFKQLSWLHYLWLIWLADMILQFIPAKGYFPIGSVKQFRKFYQPIRQILQKKEIVSFIKRGGWDSVKVFAVWTVLTLIIGILKAKNILAERDLLLISVVFYVFDLTFVLFWCPFRVWILKNRCCTTCRIFNWDHLMMFSPLLFIRGFYSISLFLLSIAVFTVWEICFFSHPERFFEETNASLKCSNCTERLCGYKNCKL